MPRKRKVDLAEREPRPKPKLKRVAVVGPKCSEDGLRDFVNETLDRILKKLTRPFELVISGEDGYEMLASSWAFWNACVVDYYWPKYADFKTKKAARWSQVGSKVLPGADYLIAFDPDDEFSKKAVALAEELSIPCRVVEVS